MSQSALLSFERHLRARGHRPLTVERYLSCVSRLIAWCKVPGEEVTNELAYRYLVEQGNRLKTSSSWFNVMFVSVVRWFESRDLALNLRGLKPQRLALQPPRWLTAEEVRRLLAAVEQRTYRMAFQVMVATGLRVSELVALRGTDIDRDQPLLRVREGKGGDGRLVLLPNSLRERLRDYWRTFAPRDVIFTRGIADRRPLCPATLNQALQRAAQRAGLTERVSSHRLRHTYAIHSLRAGMDIVFLQQQMGHRCIRSTVRYLTPDLRRPPAEPIDLLGRLGIEP